MKIAMREESEYSIVKKYDQVTAAKAFVNIVRSISIFLVVIGANVTYSTVSENYDENHVMEQLSKLSTEIAEVKATSKKKKNP